MIKSHSKEISFQFELKKAEISSGANLRGQLAPRQKIGNPTVYISTLERFTEANMKNTGPSPDREQLKISIKQART